LRARRGKKTPEIEIEMCFHTASAKSRLKPVCPEADP